MRLRIQKATVILALMLSTIAVATPRCQGQEKPEQSEANCTVDLELTGCLLYTSPSPRDLSTSRMPSSA